ncbi:MAG: phosphoribosylformylglycinamidine synthase [Anaerovoracaceae bacterium]|nr:phosphoribosylformylglycinamidine synthase [Anaerovoracaceae bacterium]
MVYRIYVEKKKAAASEAAGLLSDIRAFLGIESLEELRILNRYDVEGIDRELFEYCIGTVFSEPQLDDTYNEPDSSGYYVFAVEPLPGQFDQRADSAAQCIQIISQQERPAVASAKVYMLRGGGLTAKEIEQIKAYVINPVEAREASLDMPDTLKTEYEIPTEVETVTGFNDLTEDGLKQFIADRGLAMDIDDVTVCQEYFRKEDREPTVTEIKMIDTYWSDHCRHTTFQTTIDSVTFEDELIEKTYNEYLEARKAIGRSKPVNMMDIATIAAKCLKTVGKLPGLDESEEVNACTVKIKVNIDGNDEDWLLLFKNETHNHPTEIEPFGGAATCIGGAIRDPLSGRAYVYAAMRVTGAADPLKPVSETLEGKLPQRKIVTTAADGYASYGNQIGLATGQVDEIYHEGYVAKRMEIGAVMGAAPAENVRREVPQAGDVVILLGGKTGRDGCGGATGSSKSHNLDSLASCGAEVQKGNAPEERKLQRLFRNPQAAKMIKRCNDFGAGGVSVAIGELADGLLINLDKVPKKYEGLDGTELAISESQERMAVVVANADAAEFMRLADSENLESTVVAEVTQEPRLVMTWNGKTIVDISREFLDSNGAEKHITVKTAKAAAPEKEMPESFGAGLRALAGDLNVCSKRGLSERFDSTIGAGTVLMPFGGRYQRTPSQAMAYKISVEKKDTRTCSLMSWGYNPYISSASPYHGAYTAVIESVSKLIASGAEFKDVYLTFQEYFEKLGKDSEKWGKPLSALLGAFKAQMGLGIAAIGGKDSMSGTFEDINVPPTLVSFAVTTEDIDNILSNDFKAAGHRVLLIKPDTDSDGLVNLRSLKKVFSEVTRLMREGRVYAAYTPGFGGAAEAVMKMCFGNGIGFEFEAGLALEEIFGYAYGSFLLEVDADTKASAESATVLNIGKTTDTGCISRGSECAALEELADIYEGRLESVYTCNIKTEKTDVPAVEYKFEGIRKAPAIKTAEPKVLIPVFPGTNCEYDSAKAMAAAGAAPEIFLIKNRSAEDIAESVSTFADKVRESQMIFIPGGFSGGDEPDGSGKFITAFFRNEAVRDAVTELMDEREGLMCGICNGFQALIKLGLVPYGRIMETDESCPTLALNTIGRHQSKIVRTRIASNMSPWLADTEVGDVFTMPVSHGEGRFTADDKLIKQLIRNGQIATQYVDLDENPTNDVQFNPNGSFYAVEGITSPDGRIFGKMGHTERAGYGLYKNVPGRYELDMFRSAVKYFR